MNTNQKGFTLIELLIVVAIIGIIASIALPSFARARVSANEAGTIGDIRAVVSAEVAYQSVNGGVYGDLRCLSTPSAAGCISGYPPAAPSFIDRTITDTTQAKSGYTRAFSYGPKGSSFAYGASPLVPNQTGVRYFGGDASGRICFDQSAPLVLASGQLDPSCDVIR